MLEAMKMQHAVQRLAGGIVASRHGQPGDTVFEDHPLAFIEESGIAGAAAAAGGSDLDFIRPDLKEVLDRARADEGAAEGGGAPSRHRPADGAREHRGFLRPRYFVEYGSLVLPARRRTVTLEADRRIACRWPDHGPRARSTAKDFPEDKSRAVVVSYDYTVMAGTQGNMGHQSRTACSRWPKRLAAAGRASFAEGGGGARQRHRQLRESPATRSIVCRACPALCRWSASHRAVALPATRCCSAAATSSSPRRTTRSAWPDPR